MNAIRGLVAVIAALAVTRLLVQPLEITLVNALAQQPTEYTRRLRGAVQPR
jgi:hypothetical protein